MGTSLDSLYKDPIPVLTYQQIDVIVAEYMAGDEAIRKKNRAILLRAFHKYFMKYVKLLIGQSGIDRSSDTIKFLALFMPGSTKAGEQLSRTMGFIVGSCKHLEEEDIYNELVAKFLELLDSYRVYAGTSFAHYITQYLRWHIKDWILSQTRNRVILGTKEDAAEMMDKTTPPALWLDGKEVKKHTDLQELTLSWVMSPQSPLFNVLTSYERYLILMNFSEGIGVRQIGERLGRTKDTINKHLRRALRKLRKAYVKTKGA